MEGGPAKETELCGHSSDLFVLPDDDLFELEESEDGDESNGSGSEEQQGRRPKSAKRRRPFPLRSSSSEAGEEFDQDEAALQQAIAMSMAGED